MYRPTVRYDDAFKEYVDKLFHATHLDRNQLIRGALFTAAYSEEFRKLLAPYLKEDVPLPPPSWSLDQPRYWMGQSAKTTEREEKDVNVKHGGENSSHSVTGGTGACGASEQHRRSQPEQGQSGKVHFRGAGGITITFD